MKRNKRINYWLNDDDLAEIDRRAKAEGLSRSAYMRKLLEDARVLPAPNVDYLAYASEYQRLGRILNEYVQDFNTAGILDNGAEKVWEKIEALTEKLRDELIRKTPEVEYE